MSLPAFPTHCQCSSVATLAKPPAAASSAVWPFISCLQKHRLFTSGHHRTFPRAPSGSGPHGSRPRNPSGIHPVRIQTIDPQPKKQSPATRNPSVPLTTAVNKISIACLFHKCGRHRRGDRCVRNVNSYPAVIVRLGFKPLPLQLPSHPSVSNIPSLSRPA